MDVIALVAAGIAGAVAGSVVTHVLAERVRRRDELRRSELQRLDDAEKQLKRLAARISASLVLPNPLSVYRAVDVLRELMYLNPKGLDDAAVSEILAVLHDGVFKRSLSDTIRRWLLLDTSKDVELVRRLVAAESALAASIAARRAEVVGGTPSVRRSQSWWRR
jgi:hypothetical protein